jgi:hypothetical protein
MNLCSAATDVQVGYRRRAVLRGLGASLVCLAMVTATHAQEAPARSGTDANGIVHLGGHFIELGLAPNGSSGDMANSAIYPGFFGRRNGTAGGFLGDASGFGVGLDLRIDYFLPGTPAEGWGVAIGSDTALNRDNTTQIDYSVEDATIGETLQAVGTGTWNGLQIDHAIGFQVNHKYARYDVTLTNTTASTMSDVAYMRSFDPDNTQDFGGSFATINTVVTDYATDGRTIVEALSYPDDAYQDLSGTQALIRYYSTDPRAVARLATGLMDTSARTVVDSPSARGATISADRGISIGFDLGDLGPGESTSLTLYVVMRSANGSVTTAVNQDYVFGADDFDYLDPGIPLEGALIESLPDNGVLFVDANGNGEPDPGELVEIDDLPLDLSSAELATLVYRPDEDWTGQTSFDFRSNGLGDQILMSIRVSEPLIVTATADEGGSVNPGTAEVPQGATASFVVTADPGYKALSPVTTCGSGGGWFDGTWRTGPITSDCDLQFRFGLVEIIPPTDPTEPGQGTGAEIVPGDSDDPAWVLDAARTRGFLSLTDATDRHGDPIPAPPGDYSYPFALFDFTLHQGAAGTSTTMVINYPAELPEETIYLKYGYASAGDRADDVRSWYGLDATRYEIEGSRITLFLQDGAQGDDDWQVNSEIVDPGVPGLPADFHYEPPGPGPDPGPGPGEAVTIPTLSQWGMILLSGLLGLLAWASIRRRERWSA